MTVHTTSGVEFNYDMISEIPSPQRLYLHLTDTTLANVMGVLSQEGGLPFVEFQDYKFLQSVAMGPFGVNVALKKTFD